MGAGGATWAACWEGLSGTRQRRMPNTGEDALAAAAAPEQRLLRQRAPWAFSNVRRNVKSGLTTHRPVQGPLYRRGSKPGRECRQDRDERERHSAVAQNADMGNGHHSCIDGRLNCQKQCRAMQRAHKSQAMACSLGTVLFQVSPP